jgi:predicted ATPase
MLKQVEFHNWKSFGDATLYLDPLTVLIGANAGGKSNALDGLSFLLRASEGVSLDNVLAGTTSLSGIRGGVEWAALRGYSAFRLGAVVGALDANTAYHYSIEVETSPVVQLRAESLDRWIKHSGSWENPYRLRLFWTDPAEQDAPSIIARLYNEKRGTPRPLQRSASLLSQLSNLPVRKEITEGLTRVVEALRGIFILDPIPAHMRAYAPLANSLRADATNIAGVIAALPEEEQRRLESTLTRYARRLPEGDIVRVWAEKVGQFGADAMLYCEERWRQGGPITTVDARGMSDGTLRFLAVLTALLTRPAGSLLVVEEVDNGLHPSRSQLLVEMLREVGAQRQVDVLVTTHNPALLDALGPEMVPYIVVAHRDPQNGESRLTLLEDVRQLPKLLAGGPVGRLSANGLLEEALTRA